MSDDERGPWVIFDAMQLAPDEKTRLEREAILKMWREGFLWRLIGDPKCAHRWEPNGPNGFICMGACGGFLMPYPKPQQREASGDG